VGFIVLFSYIDVMYFHITHPLIPSPFLLLLPAGSPLKYIMYLGALV
jgi:hypothetical protein